MKTIFSKFLKKVSNWGIGNKPLPPITPVEAIASDSNPVPYRKISIPVTGMSREEAMATLAKMVADYKEDIQFDDNGTVTGITTIPFTKEMWVS